MTGDKNQHDKGTRRSPNNKRSERARKDIIQAAQRLMNDYAPALAYLKER